MTKGVPLPKDRSVVGDHISFRGLIYGPNNEQGVVFLFSKVAEDLNMYVEEIKAGFPDCVARRFSGKGWEKVYIEFEYKSSTFVTHKHNPDDCDIIVCWEHDWPDCPLEVLELREVIQGLPNKRIRRPDTPVRPGGAGSPEDVFKRLGIPSKIQKLYEKLQPQLLSLGEGVWRKVAPRDFTFYSPKRVFVYVKPQKTQLRLTLFTRGQPIEGVEPVGYEHGGFKWGRHRVSSEGELGTAVEACRKAYERINESLAANEPTGWYAEVEQEDAETETVEDS